MRLSADIGDDVETGSAAFASVKELLTGHALLLVAVVLFIEELGIPLLVPGDLLMILAGVEVARGHASLWQVLLIEGTLGHLCNEVRAGVPLSAAVETAR